MNLRRIHLAGGVVAAGLMTFLASCGDAPVAVPTPTPVFTTVLTTAPPTSGPSQGNGPLPAICAAQSVPALCVTFELTGATTVTGSNWVYAEIPDPDLPDKTCAEYGASTLESETPGLPKVTKVIGSQSVEAAFGADQPGDGAGLAGVPASGSLVVEDVSYEAEDGAAKLDLNRDGSGKLVLPRLVGGSGSLSGSISWRCIDPK